MTVVADVVARFRADMSDLDAATAKSAGGIQSMQDSGSGLHEHFDKASESTTGLTSSAAESGAALDVLSNKAAGVGSAVKEMVAGAVGVGGLASLLNLAKDMTTEMQTLSVQFNSTFGGSGQADLAQSVKLANDMGVSISSAASAYDQFGLATKGTVQNSNKDMKEFADTAAGTGNSIDSVAASVGNFYETIQRLGSSGGTRYATSLLTSHIIDQNTYNKLHVESGTGASPQEELNTILSDMQTEYAGAGQAQAKTLGGQVQTFKNNLGEGAASGAAPIISGLQSGLGDINKDMQSSGFKSATQDVSEFVSVLAKGVTVIAPVAKDLGEMAIGTISLVDHLGPLKVIVEGVVAAFILMKGVDLATVFLSGAEGMAKAAIGELSVKTATDATTTSLVAQTNALHANTAAMAEQGTIIPASEALMMTGSGRDTIGSLASKYAPGLGMAGAIGGQLVGNAIGGNVGNTIGDVATGAGIGTMIEPGIGTAIGAAAGLVVSSFQNAAKAAQAEADAVNSKVGLYEKGSPVGTTVSQIDSAYSQAKKHFDSQGLDYSKSDTQTDSLAMRQELEDTKKAHRNMNANLGNIQDSVPNMTRKDAGQFAATNNIDLSQPLEANINSIKTATTALIAFGGTLQLTAEATASKFASIATIDTGQAGETTASIPKSLKEYGLNGGDITKLAKEAGINMTGAQYGGGTSSQINLGSGGGMTPQAAAETNSNISVQQQLIQATFGVTQANWSLIQAENGVKEAQFSLGQAYFAQTQAVFALSQAQFSLGQASFQVGQAQFALAQAYFSAQQAAFGLTQAVFGLGQAQFSASQATFQLGRAELDLTTSHISAKDSAQALSTALSSGYVPNNYDAAASIAQLTSATSAQIAAYQGLVSSNQALQSVFEPMQLQMNALQSAAQVATDSIKTFQLQLQAPLQGTGAYAASHEATTVAGAGIQQQIDQLELQMVPTSDPRIQLLQAQLAKVNAQGDLQTQINTQTIGLQQFNVAQAQLAPETSYQSQLAAAQGVGSGQAAITATQTAVDNLQPTFDKLSAAMTLSNTLTSAATQAIDAEAAADQKNITSQNAVTVAQNAVTTAANAVTVATNGVAVANNGVTTAANGVKTAQDGLNVSLNAEAVAQNGVATALNNVAVAANGIWQAQLAVTSAEQGVSAAEVAVASATASMKQATNTASAQMLTNWTQFLTDMGTAIQTFGVGATIATQKMELAAAIAAVGASGGENNLLQGPITTALVGSAEGDLNKLDSGKSLDPSQLASLLGALAAAPGGPLPSFNGGGTIAGSGLATVHEGESVLTQQQVEQLWTANGGNPLWAPLAAGIAKAESGWNTSAWNQNASTGDNSVGLWQINYYGSLLPGRTAEYGPPDAMHADPNKQARAAVELSGNGANWGPWTSDRAWAAWVAHGRPAHPTDAMVNAWGFANGGVVPGSAAQEVPAILHGGEIVLSNQMLEAMGGTAGAAAFLSGAGQNSVPGVLTAIAKGSGPGGGAFLSSPGQRYAATPNYGYDPLGTAVLTPAQIAAWTASMGNGGGGVGAGTGATGAGAGSAAVTAPAPTTETITNNNNERTITIATGAVQVEIVITGSATDQSTVTAIRAEVTEAVNEALAQVVSQS